MDANQSGLTTPRKNFAALAGCLMLAIPLVRYSAPAHAADESGERRLSLPADFQAFHKDSPWNTPIPANAPTHADSDKMIAALQQKAKRLKGDWKQWTIPLFVINAEKTPKVDVLFSGKTTNPLMDPDKNGVVEGLPVPDWVWPDPKKDGHMLLVDPVQKKSWDISRVKKSPSGAWRASRIDTWDLNGRGFRKPFSGKSWWSYGARGSGMPLIAGLIRPEQIAAGEIRHALVYATPLTQKAARTGIKAALCPPASRTDGRGVGPEFIPMGARMQLDPTLNLDTLRLSEPIKIVARAMQKYGMYNSDGSSTFKVYFQNRGAGSKTWKGVNFGDLAKIPIARFRVLACPIATKK